MGGRGTLLWTTNELKRVVYTIPQTPNLWFRLQPYICLHLRKYWLSKGMFGRSVQISHLSFCNNKESVPFFTLSNNMLPLFKIVLKRQRISHSLFLFDIIWNYLVRNEYCTGLDKKHKDHIKCGKYSPLRDNQQSWLVSPQAVLAAEAHLNWNKYKFIIDVGNDNTQLKHAIMSWFV